MADLVLPSICFTRSSESETISTSRRAFVVRDLERVEEARVLGDVVGGAAEVAADLDDLAAVRCSCTRRNRPARDCRGRRRR